MNSKIQIIATIGPATKEKEMIKKMVEHHLDVVRLNFSWGTYEEHTEYIKNIREISKELNINIPIIQDLSGPRIQNTDGHEFNQSSIEIITKKDLADLEFGIKNRVDYVAMSYVSSGRDVQRLREEMIRLGKVLPIIAKIERQVALVNIDSIIENAEAIMIARGDLGNDVLVEKIPFIEKDIITKCKQAGKPVIVATQVLLSMTDKSTPTRAEMTDIAYAVTSGADALMLSEETPSGKYPLEAVEMMERGIKEAEGHLTNEVVNNL